MSAAAPQGAHGDPGVPVPPAAAHTRRARPTSHPDRAPRPGATGTARGVAVLHALEPADRNLLLLYVRAGTSAVVRELGIPRRDVAARVQALVTRIEAQASGRPGRQADAYLLVEDPAGVPDERTPTSPGLVRHDRPTVLAWLIANGTGTAPQIADAIGILPRNVCTQLRKLEVGQRARPTGRKIATGGRRRVEWAFVPPELRRTERNGTRPEPVQTRALPPVPPTDRVEDVVGIENGPASGAASTPSVGPLATEPTKPDPTTHEGQHERSKHAGQ